MDFSAYSDEQLLEQIAQQNQAALTVLYERYGTAVYSVALRVLHTPVWAEEATQDTFLKVWHRPSAWQPSGGMFGSWLLKVARNTAIDRLRKEVRHNDADEIHENSAVSDSIADYSDQIGGLLTQLSPEQAQVIALAFYQGQTHQQLADTLGVPLGTVKTRLRSGLQKLRVLWLEAQNAE
jgi:RNA polymerase sigma-70 factor, ECF subfamily